MSTAPKTREGSSRLATWLLAARPKTLAAALVPVMVGSAVAWSEGGFAPAPALAALAGAFLIQIGTNFANDYFDFAQGADTEERLGPTRAVAAGLVSPRAMLVATGVVFALAMAVGIYLVARAGWPIVAIGLASIAAGVAYTAGGRWSIGYLGLGDLFVFVFFGPVAVAGTHFVQSLVWSPQAFLASVPVGCLAVAILVVNNVRDIDGDRKAGKRTLAVRLGRRFARIEYTALLALAYAIPALQLAANVVEIPGLTEVAGTHGGWVMLPWLSIGLARPPLLVLRGATLGPTTRADGFLLNRALGQTARLLAAFGLLYAIGLCLG